MAKFMKIKLNEHELQGLSVQAVVCSCGTKNEEHGEKCNRCVNDVKTLKWSTSQQLVLCFVFFQCDILFKSSCMTVMHSEKSSMATSSAFMKASQNALQKHWDKNLPCHCSFTPHQLGGNAFSCHWLQSHVKEGCRKHMWDRWELRSEWLW